jgi:hypothetical protein
MKAVRDASLIHLEDLGKPHHELGKAMKGAHNSPPLSKRRPPVRAFIFVVISIGIVLISVAL